MKIMVTGGLGFIGSHVVDGYVTEGHELIVLDDMSTGRIEHLNPKARFINMSLLDEKLADIIRRERPDLISHHAAQVNVRTSVSDPVEDIHTNLIGTVNLLKAAGRAGVQKVIFASSGGTVYGEAKTDNQPIPETFSGQPISPYGINKLACEYYTTFYAKMYGFHWTILRYANVYGERQNPYGESGVIAIFKNRIQQGISPIIYGDGEQVRDYIHVRDVVSANLLFSHHQFPNGIYNVGTGKATTLIHILSHFYSIWPNAKPPVYKKRKLGELSWNVLSVEKLMAMGWKPRINLAQGLQELCHTKEQST